MALRIEEGLAWDVDSRNLDMGCFGMGVDFRLKCRGRA